MAAQTRIMQALEDALSEPLKGMDAKDTAIAQSLLDMNRNAILHFKEVRAAQQVQLKGIYKNMSDTVKSPEFRSLPVEEQDQIISDLTASWSSVYGHKSRMDIDTATMQDAKENLELMSKLHRDGVISIQKDVVEGLESSLSAITQFQVKNAESIKEFRKIMSQSHGLMTKIHGSTNAAIFKSLDTAGTLKIDGIYNSLVDLPKQQGNDVKLSKFISDEGFAHDTEAGKFFFNAVQSSADNILFDAVRKTINPEKMGVDSLSGQTFPIAKSQAEIDKETTRKINTMVGKIRKPHGDHVGIQAYFGFSDSQVVNDNVITPVHILEYLKEEGIAITSNLSGKQVEIPLGDPTVTFKDAEYMYRHLRNEAVRLKDIDTDLANKYSAASKKVNDALLNSPEALEEFKLADGRVTTMAKEIKIMRLRSEIEVMSRMVEVTFFG